MCHSIRNAIALVIAALLFSSCAAPTSRVVDADSQVVFVCEHGNVKSLMAASYFNRLANQRGLPYSAISRGIAPDSTTVPPSISAGLKGEGFDVSDFHPAGVTRPDVEMSKLVVLINTALPEDSVSKQAPIERWTDVPAASVDYAAASASLKTHVEELIDRLERSGPAKLR